MPKLQTLGKEDLAFVMQSLCQSGALQGKTIRESDHIVDTVLTVVDRVLTRNLCDAHQRFKEDAVIVTMTLLDEQRERLFACWADQVSN